MNTYECFEYLQLYLPVYLFTTQVLREAERDGAGSELANTADI